MFKIALRRSVQQAVDYFLHEPDLSAEEKTGVWLGLGAHELGLTAQATRIEAPISEAAKINPPIPRPSGLIVTEADFRRALEGYAPPSSPFSGRKLNAYIRPGKPRRAAWDCVISTHKSISVAALCTEKVDPVLARLVRSAFNQARGDLFAVMESQARRDHGHSADVVTGTLLVAAFTHFTSRRNDPQLHAHLVLINTTRDYGPLAWRDWYALEPIQFYKQSRALDLVFQRELNRRLREHGLNSQIMKVEGLPVAVLPAVNPTICRRLSSAHNAILAMTRDRWNRATRTPEQKRQENLLNDRCRPSKAGQLTARGERFERALSREEAAAIVGSIRLPKKNPPPAPPPTSKTIAERLREAFRLLGYGMITTKRATLMAWHASMAFPMVGIQPFLLASVDKQRRHGDMTPPGGLAKHLAQCEKHAWEAQEAFFLASDARHREARAVSVAVTPRPDVVPTPNPARLTAQTVPDLSRPSCTPPGTFQLPAGGEDPRPNGAGGGKEGSATFVLSPALPQEPLDPLPAYFRPDEDLWSQPEGDLEQSQGPVRGP